MTTVLGHSSSRESRDYMPDIFGAHSIGASPDQCGTEGWGTLREVAETQLFKPKDCPDSPLSTPMPYCGCR